MENVFRTTVKYEGKFAYDIVINDSFSNLKSELEKINLTKRDILIVTDSNVGKLYLSEVFEIFSTFSKRVTSFTIKAGEESKTLDTVELIYKKLIAEHFDKSGYLVALGGGVVGDLTGFVAATYLRGISYIQLPTSLLSQVDSSIGGKTGVNFKSYKNMIGSFYMPKLVYENVLTLNTLSEREFSSGMAEVIKHGLIKNSVYYDFIYKNLDNILKKDTKTLIRLLSKSIIIKKEIVEQDTKENGIRAVLNFGHTLGHAIEKERNFALTHGECVALGMMSAFFIMLDRNIIIKAELEFFIEMLKSFKLPFYCEDLDIVKILEFVENDKKIEFGKIKFILLKKIGEAYIETNVSKEEMKEALLKIERNRNHER